jgi:hypothetical protein
VNDKRAKKRGKRGEFHQHCHFINDTQQSEFAINPIVMQSEQHTSELGNGGGGGRFGILVKHLQPAAWIQSEWI